MSVDAEGYEAKRIEPLTDEEIQIGRDLIKHAMQKIQTVVEDFLQLQGNPQQVYMLNVRALRFFMSGQKLFDLSDNPMDADPERTQRQRIILGSVIPLLMALADNGSEECATLVDRIGNKEAELDHREILRFLSQLK